MREDNSFSLFVSPHLGDTTSQSGVSPSQFREGYPFGQVRMEYPQLGLGTLPYPGQDSRWSTCYAACGMPLAFTQEDFDVPKRAIMEDTVSKQINGTSCEHNHIQRLF